MDETSCKVVKYTSLGVHNNHTDKCLRNIYIYIICSLKTRKGVAVVLFLNSGSSICAGLG